MINYSVSGACVFIVELGKYKNLMTKAEGWKGTGFWNTCPAQRHLFFSLHNPQNGIVVSLNSVV
jgi:hypothetical protein